MKTDVAWVTHSQAYLVVLQNYTVPIQAVKTRSRDPDL